MAQLASELESHVGPAAASSAMSGLESLQLAPQHADLTDLSFIADELDKKSLVNTL